MVVNSLEGEGFPREEMYLQQDLGWDLHGTHGIWYLLLLTQKPLLPKSLYHTRSTLLEWTFMLMLKFLGKPFKLMERRKNWHSEMFLFHFEPNRGSHLAFPYCHSVEKRRKLKICVNFQKLNEATNKNQYPLPFTKEVLEMVANHEKYSFLDWFFNYHQFMIALEDNNKITFITNKGTFI